MARIEVTVGHKLYKRINSVESISTASVPYVDTSTVNDKVIDLTYMFTAGHEPSTVAEFNTWAQAHGITLSTLPYDTGTPIDMGTIIDGRYDAGNTEFQDYITAQIDAINVCGSSTDAAQTIGATDPTNAFPITGNIFLLSMEPSAVTSSLQPILNSLLTFRYNPATIKMIEADLEFKLGDRLITEREGVRYKHYIFGYTLSESALIMQDISCPANGEYLDSTASAVNDTLIGGMRMTKIEQTVEAVKIIAESRNKSYKQATVPTLNVLAGDLWYATANVGTTYKSGKWYRYNGTTWELTEDSTIQQHTAQLQTQATQISAKVDRTGGISDSFEWTLTADGFVLSAGDGSSSKEVFRVTPQGVFITGLTSGSILQSANYDDGNEGMQINLATGEISTNSGYFHLAPDGTITCTDANISGTITASSGRFLNGCIIGNNTTGTGAMKIVSSTGTNAETGLSCGEGYWVINSADVSAFMPGLGVLKSKAYLGAEGLVYYTETSGELRYSTATKPGVMCLIGKPSASWAHTTIQPGYIRFGLDSTNLHDVDSLLDYEKGSIEARDDGMHLIGTWKTNSGTSVTSARPAKYDIGDFDERHDVLFDNLISRTFKYVDGTSDRVHYGFILDELSDAMQTAELTTQECGAYCLDDRTNPTGTGGIRYSELIALNTWQIQKLKARVAELERMVSNA